MCASGAGHVECVKVLLDKGAQANLQNKASAVPNQHRYIRGGVAGVCWGGVTSV